MKTIKIFDFVGTFAENKDIARSIRVEQIEPAIRSGKDVTIDFSGVDSTTQSFIHALISELYREHGERVLDIVSFKNCNEIVQKVIGIVIDYMQQSN